MHHLEVSHLGKIFGATHAVQNLTFQVERGEILSILGPSGCGKTTTLRMIAGLEIPDSGAIFFNGRDVTGVPARARNIGMVFQNYALFPHLNVFENIAFGLRTRRLPKATIDQRVAKALCSVRMDGYERRSVHQLSGGQQQRIALARALAIEPEVLLLDEPLSNLDPSLREDLRDQIRAIIRSLGVTTVFVTHDQEEAFTLADRIAIMDSGVCRQVGRPEEVYNRPADTFVAKFLGKANLLPGSVVGLQDDVLVMVRPENLILDSERRRPEYSPAGEGSREAADGRYRHFMATVTKVIFEGPIIQYTIAAEDIPIVVRQFHHGDRSFEPGVTVQVAIPENRCHILRKS